MVNLGHYPSFDVMKSQDEWDDHTQEIVTSRLHSGKGYQFLTPVEAQMLRRICSLLVDDQSPETLEFIVQHIDQTCSQTIGEGQRKVGVPPGAQLIRSGLKAVEQGVLIQHSASFLGLEEDLQKQTLHLISQSIAKPEHIWTNIPQKELFKKLLSLTVEAYCSHPHVWSKIGYAGPAYPRGYVRTHLGQLDPWEAQPEQ